MKVFTAKQTVAEAVFNNGGHNWHSLLDSLQQFNSGMKALDLRNIDDDALRAEFIVALSDYQMVCTSLSYDAVNGVLMCMSTSSYSKDGHGINSQKWRDVAESDDREFAGETTLGEVADFIIRVTVEAAYETLHRSNSRMFPMPATDDLLVKVLATF